MKFTWKSNTDSRFSSKYNEHQSNLQLNLPLIIHHRTSSRHQLASATTTKQNNHVKNHLFNKQHSHKHPHLQKHHSFSLKRINFNSLLIAQYFTLILFTCFILPITCTNDSSSLSDSSSSAKIYSTVYEEYRKCKDTEELYKKGFENSTILDSKNYCPPFFDNYLCWFGTKLDETLILNCSIVYSSPTSKTSRKCLGDGKWADGNYSQCGSNRYPEIELDYLKHVHDNVWKNVNLSYPVYYEQLYKCIDNDLYKDFKDKIKKEPYCNATFDGYTCWPRTFPNKTVFADCPKHTKAANYSGAKHCLADGTWYKHPLTNRTWSDYSGCADWEDLKWRNKINVLYQIGYTISLIAMLISLYIFFSFRSLKCTRITVHKNLFISFIIGNVHWIYDYLGIFNRVDVLQNNSIFCRIMFSSTKYFTHTNYMWTLCEGLYLYCSVVYGFIDEKKLIFYLMIIGWLSPLVYYLPYIVLRSLSSHSEDSMRCWVDDSPVYENINQYPIFVVILLNIFFLIGIIRVLLSKLSPQVNNHHKKTIKAFFFLFPLLSLQYIITLNRPSDGSPLEPYYDSILCFAASLQGLFVSLIYCFFNNEVTTAIKQAINRQLLTKNDNNQRSMFFRNRSCTTTVV